MINVHNWGVTYDKGDIQWKVIVALLSLNSFKNGGEV